MGRSAWVWNVGCATEKRPKGGEILLTKPQLKCAPSRDLSSAPGLVKLACALRAYLEKDDGEINVALKRHPNGITRVNLHRKNLSKTRMVGGLGSTPGR